MNRFLQPFFTVSLALLLSFQPMADELRTIDSLHQLINRQQGADKAKSLLAVSEAYRFLSFDESIKAGHAALDAAGEWPVLRGAILRSLGQGSQLAGDFDLADGYYRQALKTYTVLNDKYNIARLSNMIGDLKNNLGQYDSALFYLENVDRLAIETGNDTMLAFSLLNKGIARFETGSLEAAHDAFYRASLVFRELNDSITLALAEMNISQVLWQWNQNDEAIALLEKTILFAGRNQLDDMLSRACSNLGLIYYYDKKNYSRAHELFQQSLKIREAKGYPIPIAHVLVNLANVYSAGGNYEEALQSLRRALQIYASSGAVQGILRVHFHLAEVFFETKQHRQSVMHLEQCLQIAKKHQIENYNEIGTDLMMKNYVALNDFASFLKYFEPYKSAHDSLSESFIQLQAREANIRFRALELEAERERLSAENDEIRKQLEARQYWIAGTTALLIFSLLMFLFYKALKRRNYHTASAK